MVNHLHGSQPQAISLQFLHRPQTPRLLLPLLQSRAARPGAAVGRQGGAAGFRAAEKYVSGYEGAVQWVQAAFYEHAEQQEALKSWGSDGYFYGKVGVVGALNGRFVW